MNKLKKYYLRTVLLNLVFILLIPLLLTITVGESMIALFIYVIAYSILESILDANTYDNITISMSKIFIILITNFLFNILLLIGVSIIISYLLSAGLVPTFVVIVLWMLLLSTVELEIDKKLAEAEVVI